MELATISFLFLFLPVVSLVFYLVKPKYANGWLLLASLFYYGLIAPNCLPILLLVVLTAYLVGLGNQRIQSTAVKRSMLWLGVTVLTALLFILRADQLFGRSWLNNVPYLSEIGRTIIPVGASFFVLQAIMYMVDTYKGEESLVNPIDLALYISFFPKIVSGPLLKLHQFRRKSSKEHRAFHLQAVSAGVWRIGVGLFKKILIANQLSHLAGILFDSGSLTHFSVLEIWLCVLAYTLQIYLDFSGYTDMAIGVAAIFGYGLPENFNDPYTADSLKEFWRRWHMSLSGFFRDYIYIPLGGNRHGRLRWLLSMAAVWFLTGLWHGFTWNFLVWAAVHGVLLAAETLLCPDKSSRKRPKWIGHAYTLLTVMLLWVVFRAESLGQAAGIITGMFGAGGIPFANQGFWFLLRNYSFVLVLAFAACIPAQSAWMMKIRGMGWYQTVSAAVLLIGTFLSIAFMYMNVYQPFLYEMF